MIFTSTQNMTELFQAKEDYNNQSEQGSEQISGIGLKYGEGSHSKEPKSFITG
jgi:hypothetical protein